MSVRSSRRRFWERALTLLVPTVPYRCRSCQSRFWRRSGALFNLPRILALTAVTGLMILFAIRTLGLLQPAENGAAGGSEGPLPAATGEPSPEDLLPPPELARPTPPQSRPGAEAPAVPAIPEEAAAEASPPAGDPGPGESPPKDLPPTPRVEDPERRGPYSLSAIRERDGGGVLELEVLAGTPIRDFDTFTLEDPRRIVVDLPGAWRVGVPEVIELGHHLASRIRVGLHPQMLRLVIDVAQDTAREPVVESREQGLMLRLTPVSLRPLPLAPPAGSARPAAGSGPPGRKGEGPDEPRG